MDSKYVKEIKIASVVDKFPPAAIIAGSLPTNAYTNVIVKTQLKNCSNVWETLVDFMLPSPAKYPLKTAEEATNIIAGAKTIKADVPLSEMFGYVTTLRTLSSGRATSTMEFSHYAETPANISEAVIKKAKGNA